MADVGVAFDGRDSNDDTRLRQPAASSAAPTAGANTEQPERELKPGNPNLAGAAPPTPKKGMADKVKDLFEGAKNTHRNKSGSAVGSGVGHTPDSSPYGTGADEQQFTGHSLDPTAPPTAAPARNNFRQQGAPPPGPWPHPTNPRHTGAPGEATFVGEHGHAHPGPQEEGVKREGFLSKIKDRLQSPRSTESVNSKQ